MDMAKLVSTWSKDPSTKCGAVITDKKFRIISTGYNGFPENFPDDSDLYNNRDMKYNLMVHSEVNAILFANRKLEGCYIFCYPMIPCCRCATVIAQSKIDTVIFPTLPKHLAKRWAESEKISKLIFSKCSINIIGLEGKND
jgi:dCMP deaminase